MREYVLAERYAGISSVAPPTSHPYVEGFTLADIADPRTANRAAVDLARTREVAGVLTYDEGSVWSAAHATEALGLRGNTAAAVEEDG